MRCTETTFRRLPAAGARAACLALVLLIAGCAVRAPAPDTERPPAAPGPSIASPPPAAAARPGPRYLKLPAPPVSRNWDDFKLVAARRLVEAHPDTSYMGTPPEPLLGIPVLEVDLNADGSVRLVKVLREPRQAKETIQMAIDAVHRAAPYGDVSLLPRPWRFVEVFLFDDDHRFKPATLDR